MQNKLLTVLLFNLMLIRADDRREVLQNKDMFGGDMAGGMNVPTINSTNFMDQSSGRCWSSVGMNRLGSQTLNLQSRSCWYKGTIIHEFLHAFGFLHEHQRYDRDLFITINQNNVNPDYSSSFTVDARASSTDVGIPYDVESIMHYGAFAFGLLNKTSYEYLQTIVVKSDPTRLLLEPYDKMNMSEGNVQEIALFYKGECTLTTSSSSSTTTTTTTTRTTKTTPTKATTMTTTTGAKTTTKPVTTVLPTITTSRTKFPRTASNLRWVLQQLAGLWSRT
ncbi:unnamed protein product [Notodromas monacha]|uniref:Metalloendopeptidase n=1 Tax=Notodromas monacha TaxID=399045 RepID=A0A7R9GIA9_9CRUS|nr:unnamed protein product [Notodromas monacha]CAG0923771.1 unnamed protein product [Notodromas monacha]